MTHVKRILLNCCLSNQQSPTRLDLLYILYLSYVLTALNEWDSLSVGSFAGFDMLN